MKELILALTAVMFMGCGITRVDPGYEGIKVNLHGDNRGVDDVTIVTGRVFYNPVTEMVLEFPTHMQGYVWTKDDHEGSREDESVSFTSADRVQVNVDVEARLSFKPGRTPYIYVAHRKEPAEIVKTYMRGKIRDAFVRCGSNVTAQDILGGGGVVTLQDCAKEKLTEWLGEDYDFDTIVVAGAPRVPDQIKQMIDETATARQRAEQAENQVRVKEAEARQRVAESTGKAEAILVEARAQAEANQAVARSLTKDLVMWQAVQKWNGVQPQVVGDNGVILDLSK